MIDKIKTETAVMKRVLSTVDSWCVTDGVRKEKERLTAALRENHLSSGNNFLQDYDWWLPRIGFPFTIGSQKESI